MLHKLPEEEGQSINVIFPSHTSLASVRLHIVCQEVKMHKNKQFMEDMLGCEVQEQCFK